jgi:hypothetical protein
VGPRAVLDAVVKRKILSWVGPRAVLDAVVKRKIPSPRRESNPRIPIVQPIALSLYRLSYRTVDGKFERGIRQ